MQRQIEDDNISLFEDAAQAQPLDLSNRKKYNAQPELASIPANCCTSLASEFPFIPTVASAIVPLPVAMNMANTSTGSSSPASDSSNSSVDSMTPRIYTTTGTMKQGKKTKGQRVYSSAKRATSSDSSKRVVKTRSTQVKLKAIECVLIHKQTKASVSRALEVAESTLRGWCKRAEVDLENKKNLKPQVKFNNKPPRGIESICDNLLLSSQTNHALNDSLNVTKENIERDNQTDGSTITQEDIEVGITTGEKLFTFLEGYGGPLVTQFQLTTLRSLIENLKVKNR